MGIHGPKNRDEADFARRRLIFDDFFYLQVSLYIPDINLEVVASYE
jgi:RecG-like helicase